MKTYSITPKGQVTIPTEIREKLKLKPGDRITYVDTDSGVLIKPAKTDMSSDFGFLKNRRKSSDIRKIKKAVRKKIAKKVLSQ